MKNAWHPWTSPIQPGRYGDPVCFVNGAIHAAISWAIFLGFNSLLHGQWLISP